MTFKEIIKELKELKVTPEKMTIEKYDKKKLQKRLGEVETVLSEFAGTDTLSHVFHFPDHDVYIRVDAYYSSFGGPDYGYSTFKEVRPKSKIITVYE